MTLHSRRESLPLHHCAARPSHHVDIFENDLVWPFNKLDDLDRDDVRETAYEIFFTSCRSSPGFGGRNSVALYPSSHESGDHGAATSPRSTCVVMSPTSRVKRALGLKMLKRSPSTKMQMSGVNGVGTDPSSPKAHNWHSGATPGILSATIPGSSRQRRPMTAAEIMRQQMRVAEQSDNRLRKTLMRTLVGQMGRRAETIILPLELLRNLKPSEFNDSQGYHRWQKRQLKILEAGILLHPSVQLEKANTFAMRLRDIIRASEPKPIDVGKNSDTMRTLCNAVVSLSWRNGNGSQTDVCHWADGFPLNIHLYVALLQSIFDIKDETLVLDEVDELLELIKKTWLTLGISRPIHNICFSWVLFQQYIMTAQLEPDLLCASHAMLAEVANDAKRPDRDSVYVKILSSVLKSMLMWAEKRLLHYHDYFQMGTVGQVENLLPLALTASKILGEDLTIKEGSTVSGDHQEKGNTEVIDLSEDRVDFYIRCSVKNAFAKMIETEDKKEETEEVTKALTHLAKRTEDLATKERQSYSCILKKWHPTAAAVAATTLHSCYGTIFKQYLSGVCMLTNETIEILQRAGKLENFLVQMVVEDSVECDDGGKSIVREMIPFEVDSIILNLFKRWIDNRMRRGRECLHRAKDSETWNPKSKTEPYALSAVELVKLAKETVDEFFEIPIGITEDLVQDLAYDLDRLFLEYTKFVSSCGSKQSYIPQLPPLTRCNRDSKMTRFWKIAAPCNDIGEHGYHDGLTEANNPPRPSTSRGTQRLYIRLNTLHYLLSHIPSLDKTLSVSPRITLPSRNCFPNNTRSSQLGTSFSYFDLTNTSIQAACQYVSEVAAYRLVFLDTNSVLYESLYVDDVVNARIRPALSILNQNLILLSAIVTDRAQSLAVREVMKASFEAFFMVLLAGGGYRAFSRSDHEMIEEDFKSLKSIFCTCGEGLIAEDLVEREAGAVEGVIDLMGQNTERLMEDFSIITSETSGIGVVGSGKKLPMPPTTGRWNRGDPNTILRVLCHRNDRVADNFLKKTFQLAKRRG